VEGVEIGGGIGHPQSPACCGDKDNMSTAPIFSLSAFFILLFMRAHISWYLWMVYTNLKIKKQQSVHESRNYYCLRQRHRTPSIYPAHMPRGAESNYLC